MKQDNFDKIVSKSEHFLSKNWIDDLEFSKPGYKVSGIRMFIEIHLHLFKVKFKWTKRGNYDFDRAIKDRLVEMIVFLIEEEKKREV